MTPIELAIFVSRVEAICQEMGVVLQRAAFSPNIKERLDFSCALFDEEGLLFAQAAHIPVHLGSMAFAMRDIVRDVLWAPGDMLVVNDPFLGGTHLPDVTLIAPLFIEDELTAFVANRAHHANIGATTPGSMPISRSLEEEGLIIPPTLIVRKGEVQESVMQSFHQLDWGSSRLSGDFAAQMSANRIGVDRLQQLCGSIGADGLRIGIEETNGYGDRLAQSVLHHLPPGQYSYADLLDDDGTGQTDIQIKVRLTLGSDGIAVDFAGTSEQVEGNLNCPLSVAAAAVYYVFRCLMPAETPACHGTFRSIRLKAPEGCLVNARRPAAVAAGNVETSMRMVDVVLGALAQAIPERIPAAAQGTMNNLAMGSRILGREWDYYETIGGGMGGSFVSPGLSAVQSHMTNTLNTPIEILEMHYPIRVWRYGLRRNSGGAGKHPGGDGLIREFEFLEPAEITLLTDRRLNPPWGLAGGGAGKTGENCLNDSRIEGKCHIIVASGDHLTIKTPGGGGWGVNTSESADPVNPGNVDGLVQDYRGF